tara:strand:+ start:41 stop:724 length:684 start_codon:yes stop_codon:yes gene_type:complete
MKLKDLIASNDFSAYSKEKCGLYNYYGGLSDILYPDGYQITDDHDDAIEKSGVITRIAIREWLCTDENVGFYLYFVGEVPVVTMYQSGRKSYPEYNFLSTDSFALLREFINECKPEPLENEFRIPILNDMDLRLDCSIEKADMTINCEDFGLSSATITQVDTIQEFTSGFDKMDSGLKEHLVQWFTTTIEDHESFVQELEDPADIEFAENAAKENLHAMKLFLEKCA